MAQAENENLPEEEMALINKRWGLVIMALESVSRMKTSSAEVLEDELTARIITPEIQLGRTSTAKI